MSQVCQYSARRKVQGVPAVTVLDYVRGSLKG